jgi:predicted DNA-binding protein YlxM (UPF0122 family)
MASQVVSAEKRYRMSLLLDIYGEPLTEKQRTFLRRYYEEDFSFGEIAKEYSISRQAVFDSVKHGEASLENYERVLKLVRAGSKSAKNERAGLDGAAKTACAARLRTLSEAIATSSIDSDVTWITRELQSIAMEIERAEANEESELTVYTGDIGRDGASESAPAPWNAGRRPQLLRSDGPEID